MAMSRQDRPFIPFLKTLKFTNLIGVEIGVLDGVNAFNMLNELDIKKLYLIDPYLIYDGYKKEGLDAVEDGLNIHYKAALHNLSPYKDKVEFILKKSSEAMNEIPDVDFVYIDGNHKLIEDDILLYYTKVKQGGLIGGDNFELKIVAHAVIEFAFKNKLDLYCRNYGYYTEWWIVK